MVTVTANIIGSNSYHVVWADGVTTPITESTVLDGFTITAGQANDSTYPHSSGGGMYCNGADPGNRCSPSLSHLHFIANIATGAGGAMFNDGYRGDSSPALTHVSFAGNEAEWGGGMSNFGGDSGNSDPTLVNVTFSGNRAAFGGAMDNYADIFGFSSPSLVNVTFANNVATVNGGAIHNDPGGTGAFSGRSSPSLSNVILWGNTAITGSQIYNNGATAVLSYTLIQSDSNAIVNDNGGSVNYGPNILTSDPLFANALGTDGISGTLDDNLRLDSFSPAIDAGNNTAISETTDLDGNARFYNDADVADTGNGTVPIVDMGAYERQGSSCATYSVIHVDRDAAGNNNGTSWTNAFTNLQAGLALARTCAITEIWVATGVYTPGLSQSDTFTLTSGIQLYGGFAATETLRTERDWETNVTVLSGDIAGDDTSDANGVVTDTANISGGNSYHVVYADGASGTVITDTTVLDGFTITAGQATGPWPGTNGGGLYCDGVGSGNECSPTLSNLTFSGNWADIYGGAMANDGRNGGQSSPTLNNVTFSNNFAGSDGGAMHNDGSGGESSPILSDATFSGNHAGTNGGAMFNDGRGSGLSRPNLTNVTFSNNLAGDKGGAIFNDGASVGESSPSLVNVTFVNNEATSNGGAMYNFGDNGTSQPYFNQVIFAGNSAGNNGGAMTSQGSSGGVSQPTIINTIFSGNTAPLGGAMYNGATGGTSQPNLINVTFANNSATDSGGGMFNTGDAASPSLTNVIMWGNTATISGTQIYNEGVTSVINYTLVQSGSNAIVNSGAGTVTYGPNILTADPLFADALGADGISGTLDDDLRLLPVSPAIDSGDNSVVSETTDLDGNPRFFDDAGVADSGNGTAPIVDMGAYERQSNSSPDITLTGNGQVISSGDSTPATADDSDFGSVTLGQVVTHTFTIRNEGTVDLTLTGTPAITLTNGSAFIVTQPVSTTLAAGEATTFAVTFAPQSAGAFTDTVTIASDDPDENPYTFVVSGTGTNHTIFLPLILNNTASAASAVQTER